MNENIIDNISDNRYMSKYILSKYRQNIDNMVNSISILPKNYRKKESLDSRWKVYINYSRHGNTKQLCRSSYIRNGQEIWINKLKDHRSKVTHIHHIRDTLIYDLKHDPRLITTMVHGHEKALALYPEVFNKIIKPKQYISIENAFDEAHAIKKGKISESFYRDLQSHKNRFLKHIGSAMENDISLLDRNMLTGFLDSIGASNRTYNNSKANLSALLSVMEEKEWIEKNFLKGVKNLKTKPEMNKAFSQKQVNDILRYLKKENYLLYGYCMHVYHGLMRPITVNRLRVRDIDTEKKMFNTRTKTFDFIKIITGTLYNEFYKDLDLDSADPDMFIFGYYDLMENWQATDKNRQKRYGKRFRVVKEKFNLDRTYTIYSFRHAAVAKIFETKYEELKQSGVSNYKMEAVRYVMPFLNHTNEKTTLNYLRGISTLVHVDWSKYLE